MKWPDEEQREDDYPGQYWTVAGRTIERYQAAPWRRAAVASTRKLIESCLRTAKDSAETPQPPDGEQLREWLDEHNLSYVTDALEEGDSHNGVSIRDLLLVEAAGIVFCNRPTALNWQMVGRLIGRDPAARRILVDLVEHRMSARAGLREDIRKTARGIVERFKQKPSSQTHRSDHATVAEIQRRWKAKPELHEIWFGLRSLGYIMPYRSDWHIFDLLFEIDIDFAAEQIEAYGEPHQAALILQFGALDPNRRFSDWIRLANCALPAFEVDGTWNGRVLLPLVLLAAQDAFRSGQDYRSDDQPETERNDARFAALAKAIAEALWARPDGEAATLRWGGWLFRSTMSTLDAERLPFPHDLSSRARPIWLIVEALLLSPASAKWFDLRPTDVAAEDELCLEAIRILAARDHGHRMPGRDLLFQMLPDEPEDFLDGEGGKYRRELPSLFVIWGNRADAIGARVIAAALFDQDVAFTFAELWRRTRTLREIAEHGHAFRSDEQAFDDYARRASETIRFVIALGINLLDYVQDERQPVAFDDRRATALALFSTLHDATREMLAIDPIGRRNLVSLHDHLCVRRFVYQQVSSEGRSAAAPMTSTDQPTMGNLLYERCEIGRSFFEGLQMLRANGAQIEHIKGALESVGLRLDHLVEQAQRLNAIEHSRAINLTYFEAGQ